LTGGLATTGAFATGFTAALATAGLAEVFAVFGAVFLAITFFTVLDLAAAGLRAALALEAWVFEALALDARAVVREELRLAAAAFLVVVLFAAFAILLERVVLLDTTCAWNRHAPVHGLSGESSHLRPIKGGN
jgi:hypothetical protein